MRIKQLLRSTGLTDHDTSCNRTADGTNTDTWTHSYLSAIRGAATASFVL